MHSTFPVAHPADGMPRVAAYETLVASDFYHELEAYSDAFLRSHRTPLAPYARKWVADPLHQWSRQWEYPWVFAELEELVTARAGAGRPFRVLDAGSGVTFFPYLLTERFPGTQVTCCDQDNMLAPIYADVTAARRAPVEFRLGPLARLDAPDASLDALYCISVLEHTRDYERILDQFVRALRPGGSLLLTFDISIDGRSDIAPEAAGLLIDAIDQRFERVRAPRGAELARGLGDPELFTTATLRGSRPELLPWRSHWRRDLMRVLTARRPGPPFYLCTVACGHWRRPGGPSGA